jgi:hypothetical protein
MSERKQKTGSPIEKIQEEETSIIELEQRNAEPDFPDEWVSIAAYYIWKRDGEHDGKDIDYWERAKVELTTMWQEGVLPVEWEKEQRE